MALLMKPRPHQKNSADQGRRICREPPQYWHRVELSEDAQFNINFWAEADTGNKAMFKSSRIHSQPIEALFDGPDEQ